MKILIVSSSFYPNISPRSFRTTELVKELCRQGNDVTLLTNYCSQQDDIIAQYKFTIIDLGYPKFQRIEPNKNKYFNLGVRALNRGLNLLFEYPDIGLMFSVKKKLKNLSGFDLMISIAVPHPIHWGVAWALKKQNLVSKVWIADCGDAYMGADLDTFKKMFYFKYIEKYWCKKVDYITIPHILMKKNFYQEYASKFRQIPQGFNFSETKSILQEYKQNEKPTFAFAGTFIEGKGDRDPRPFIEYILNRNFDFDFYIFTSRKDLIEPYMERAKGKIKLYDYIPRTNLLEFLSKMDFLLNIAYDPSRQLPSKLIDYFLIGRPILNIYNDKLDDEIRKNINLFFDGDYSLQLKVDNLEQYNINNVANSFINLAINYE